jgi:hypothetical protein
MQHAEGELTYFPASGHQEDIDMLGEPYSIKEYSPIMMMHGEFGVRRVVEVYVDLTEPYECFECLGRLTMENGQPVIKEIDGVECVEAERVEPEMQEWLRDAVVALVGPQMAKRISFL